MRKAQLRDAKPYRLIGLSGKCNMSTPTRNLREAVVPKPAELEREFSKVVLEAKKSFDSEKERKSDA